jgi:polysaccharide biosynthesis transport protein
MMQMKPITRSGASEWTLEELFAALRRRSPIVLAAISAGLVLALLYLWCAETRYTATATILPDMRSTPPAPTAGEKSEPIDPAFVENQIETIRSERIALEVVDKLGLWRDPEFVRDRPGVLELALAWAGLRPLLPNTAAVKRRKAVKGFLQKLDVNRVGRSYVTRIAFTSTDPLKAATIANGIADAYIQNQLGSKFSYGERTSQWTQQRIASLDREAAAAARAVESFKSANGIATDSEGRTADERNLEQLSAALKTPTDDAGAQDRPIDAEPKVDQDAAAAGVRASRERIEAMRQRIAANRPKIDQLRALEANRRRVEQLRDVVQRRLARIADFVQDQSFPVTEAQIVSEAAEPLTRSWPRMPVVLLVGFCGGLVAGVGGALVRDVVDRTIRRHEQFERNLDIRSLGSLPRVRIQRTSRDDRGDKFSFAIARWISKNLGDRLRTVLLAVDEGRAEQSGTVVGIVSAERGVGKTTLALGLAVVAAGAGRSTLLLDADLRGFDLTRHLAPEPSAGLAAAVEGRTSLANAVTSHFLGFHLLGQHAPSGSVNSVDVLSRSMQTLFQDLRKKYDYVIVDTPAMLDRIDVGAATKLFDAVVIVTQQGRTRIDDLDAVLARNPRIRSILVGAVMNKSWPAVDGRATCDVDNEGGHTQDFAARDGRRTTA